MSGTPDDPDPHGDDYDVWANLPSTDYEGYPASTILRTHSAARCVPPCPLHAPSDHPLADAPLSWRADRGLFERECAHGVRHPDVDSVAFLIYVLPAAEVEARAPWDHGCDGCCGGRATYP